MLRKSLLFLLIVIFIVALFFLSSPLWGKRVLFWGANHYLKDIRVESLDYDRATFRRPNIWDFSSLFLTLKKDKAVYRIRIPSFSFSWNFPNIVHINFEQASIESPLFEAEGISFEGNITLQDAMIEIRGRARGNSLSVNNYTITNIRSSLGSEKNRVIFPDFTADCYAGTMEGEISLEYAPKISYSITIKIRDAESGLLKEADPAVFSQIAGKISGLIRLAGRPEGIDHLEGSFDMTEGGTLKASVLDFLIPHLPESQQKKNLKALVRSNGNILFEKGTLTLKNLDRETLSSQIDLESKAFNLDLDVGLDVHVDGGLNQLLDLMKSRLAE